MLTKFNFIAILLIAFVDYLGIGLVYPVFAALLFDPNETLIHEGGSLAFRGAMLGLLIGLTPLTQFFCSPLLGKISDRKGRKKVLIFGSLMGILGYCLAIAGIWTHSLGLLFLYRIFVGISEGKIAVAQAMIADMSSQEIKGRRFALFNACCGIGFTIGPFLGGKLADPSMGDWCGYATPFFAAGFMCLINFILIFFKFPETHATGGLASFKMKDAFNNIQKIFLLKKFRTLFIASFAFAFGWSFFNEFIPLLLRERFAFTTGETGNYYAYGGVWYALGGGVITAYILKFFSPEQVVIKALAGCAICMLLFLVIGDASGIWWILPPFMTCLSAIFPTTGALVSNQANQGDQGEVLGAYQSVIGGAMGLSPILVGSLIGGYPALTAWGGAFAMLLAMLTLLFGKRAAATKALEALQSRQ